MFRLRVIQGSWTDCCKFIVPAVRHRHISEVPDDVERPAFSHSSMECTSYSGRSVPTVRHRHFYYRLTVRHRHAHGTSPTHFRFWKVWRLFAQVTRALKRESGACCFSMQAFSKSILESLEAFRSSHESSQARAGSMFFLHASIPKSRFWKVWRLFAQVT